VKEAFRLLNKSIIRVETPDIDFEEREEELVNGEGGEGEGGEREKNGGGRTERNCYSKNTFLMTVDFVMCR